MDGKEIGQQSDGLYQTMSDRLEGDSISWHRELTVKMISQHAVSSTGEHKSNTSLKSNQRTKESLRSTVQEFCRIRVFCSDRKSPGDIDVVPVHGCRQHFDAAMPLLVKLGLLFSGLVGVLWSAMLIIVQMPHRRVAVVDIPRAASDFLLNGGQ
jgi:hypothetical protein